MNTINTSPKWWGFSEKPKNWKKYMLDSRAGDDRRLNGESKDGYDIFELIAENSPMKSRTLTDEEIKELKLDSEAGDNEVEDHSQPKPAKSMTESPSKPPKVPLIDSSHSYA